MATSTPPRKDAAKPPRKCRDGGKPKVPDSKGSKGELKEWEKKRLKQVMEANEKARLKHLATPKLTQSKAASIAAAQAKLDAAKEELEKLLQEQGRGRPTNYQPDFALRAEGLCLLGLTNDELADRFGVDVASIARFIREVPEFRLAVYRGREGGDADVLMALKKAAIGYTHDEDDIRTVSLGGNAGSEIVITPTVKHYPPNPQMAALYVHNRLRKRGWTIPSGNSGPSPGDAPAEAARAAQEAIAAALSLAPSEDQPPKDNA